MIQVNPRDLSTPVISTVSTPIKIVFDYLTTMFEMTLSKLSPVQVEELVKKRKNIISGTESIKNIFIICF